MLHVQQVELYILFVAQFAEGNLRMAQLQKTCEWHKVLKVWDPIKPIAAR